MAHTPETRRLAGSKGGLTKASRFSPEELTRQARDGFVASFVAKVDPDGRLDPAERERRAYALLRAHMADLALRSAAARRARKHRRVR